MRKGCVCEYNFRVCVYQKPPVDTKFGCTMYEGIFFLKKARMDAPGRLPGARWLSLPSLSPMEFPGKGSWACGHRVQTGAETRPAQVWLWLKSPDVLSIVMRSLYMGSMDSL